MKKRVSILIMCAGLALLWVAAQQNRQLVESRRLYGLAAAEPLENAPPMVAFTTVALGGFRGLLADALWLRTTRLQEQGRYFELVQLSDWITKLEPRCVEIWGYHAWNMATMSA